MNFDIYIVCLAIEFIPLSMQHFKTDVSAASTVRAVRLGRDETGDIEIYHVPFVVEKDVTIFT